MFSPATIRHFFNVNFLNIIGPVTINWYRRVSIMNNYEQLGLQGKPERNEE